MGLVLGVEVVEAPGVNVGLALVEVGVPMVGALVVDVAGEGLRVDVVVGDVVLDEGWLGVTEGVPFESRRSEDDWNRTSTK